MCDWVSETLFEGGKESTSQCHVSFPLVSESEMGHKENGRVGEVSMMGLWLVPHAN